MHDEGRGKATRIISRPDDCIGWPWRLKQRLSLPRAYSSKAVSQRASSWDQRKKVASRSISDRLLSNINEHPFMKIFKRGGFNKAFGD
jgi:hypothetical protein